MALRCDGSMVARVAREHETVDHERTLAVEQLRQPHRPRWTGRERVVHRHDPTRWEIPARCGNRLRRATKRDLLPEQPIARGAILRRLTWKSDRHGPLDSATAEKSSVPITA